MPMTRLHTARFRTLHSTVSHWLNSITRGRTLPLTLAALVLTANSLTSAAAEGGRAGHPHAHGVARLDVAIDGNSLSIHLEAPLDNLVGFERAPRTAAEQRRADAAVVVLKAASTLFGIEPAAGCSLRSVDLQSSALKLGAESADAPAQAGHADLDGDFVFDCGNPAKIGFIEVGLFKAFPRMQRLEVQAVTAAGQLKRTLQRPASRLDLTGR